jgi:integrase
MILLYSVADEHRRAPAKPKIIRDREGDRGNQETFGSNQETRLMSELTNETLKSLKGTGKDYRVRDKAGKGSGYHGFGVKVTSTGKRSFFLEYTFSGKRRFLNLGAYPAKSLKDARKEAIEARSLVDKGIDPQLEKQRYEAEEEAERKRQEAELRGVTVREALDYYLTTISASTASNAKTKFNNSHCNVYKLIGDRRIKDITEDDLWDLLDRHTDRGKQSEAARLRAYMKAAFNKAKRHRPFKLTRWNNPFLNIDKPEEGRVSNDRALNQNEIMVFLTILNQDTIIPLGIKSVLKLLLITGQRVEETSKLKWSTVDLENRIWDIPAEDNKTGKTTGKGHIVPLPALAIELIQSMPRIEGEDLVLVGRNSGQPYRAETISKNLKKLLASHADSHPIDSFTPRDIRRTVKTHMSRIGILKEVRDRIQGHAMNDVASKHYDRYDYLKEKRAGLKKWERELNRIISAGDETGT